MSMTVNEEDYFVSKLKDKWGVNGSGVMTLPPLKLAATGKLQELLRVYSYIRGVAVTAAAAIESGNCSQEFAAWLKTEMEMQSRIEQRLHEELFQ